MNDIHISYRPNKIIFLFATLFFGLCCWGMSYAALTNDKGLILNGIITLSVQNATIFYWCFSALAAGFVVCGIVLLVLSFVSKNEIVISSDCLIAPKNSFSKKMITVNFKDINGVEIQAIQKTRILNIYHVDGRLSIADSMLPGKKHFEELVSILQSNVKSLKVAK
ncbi:MAG: hypothetical protein GX640_02355 [Fibrobacter sp.]|nr:hypothetical protein [Fibrobacter sp.]